ncbi:hypothetical protein ACQP3D_30515, partial [Escherichia coli]
LGKAKVRDAKNIFFFFISFLFLFLFLFLSFFLFFFLKTRRDDLPFTKMVMRNADLGRASEVHF